MPDQTQKALLVTEIEKPLVLVTTQPIPQPTSSQIQVRVTVAGLNPHDQKCRDRGLFIANNLPAVLANDIVGKVIAIGSDVTQFRVGDRVVGQGQAGLQEITVLDEPFTSRIPDEVTDDEAATLPINSVSSMVAIFAPMGLSIPPPWTSAASSFDYAGSSILIIGGGSNCGRFGVQLAALAGIGCIVVVGGDEAELKSYGATHIIDRHGTPEQLLTQIQAVVGDDLIYAFDAINPPAMQFVGINALSSTKKGRLARLIAHGNLDESKIQPKESGYEIANVHGASHATPDIAQVFCRNLPQYLLDGKIKPSKFEVIQGFDVDRVNEVLDRYRDGKRVTKPHVHLS